MRGSRSRDAAANSSDEMSQEKPQFKVTDRRLFNPDGTPRDIERAADATAEDSRAPAATGSETAAARPDADSSAAADSATTQPAAGAARAATSPPPPSSSAAAAASEPRPAAPPAAAASASTAPFDAADAAADVAGAEDPTAFANLVMFIASPAAASMGMTEHPGLAPGELDLPLAKHCIDLLGTLQQKTLGHLGPQEAQILEGLLAELRMQYISLTSTRRPPGGPPPAAAPPGFSGNDITGGR